MVFVEQEHRWKSLISKRNAFLFSPTIFCNVLEATFQMFKHKYINTKCLTHSHKICFSNLRINIWEKRKSVFPVYGLISDHYKNGSIFTKKSLLYVIYGYSKHFYVCHRFFYVSGGHKYKIFFIGKFSTLLLILLEFLRLCKYETM